MQQRYLAKMVAAAQKNRDVAISATGETILLRLPKKVQKARYGEKKITAYSSPVTTQMIFAWEEYRTILSMDVYSQEQDPVLEAFIKWSDVVEQGSVVEIDTHGRDFVSTNLFTVTKVLGQAVGTALGRKIHLVPYRGDAF